MEALSVPQLGEGIVDVRILRLLKQVGEPVERDEPLYELETDKAVQEMESPVTGTIRKWLVQEGDLVPVGAAIVELESARTPIDRGRAMSNTLTAGAACEAGTTTPVPPEPAPRVPPRIRALARAKGLSDSEIDQLAHSNGTKPLTVDAVAAVAGEKAADSPTEFLDRPVPEARQRLNRLMIASLPQVVPAVVSTTIDAGLLTRACQALQSSDVPVFATDFTAFAYLVAKAAAEHPPLRTRRLTPDQNRVYSHVHLGIAVRSDAGALASGVVHDADADGFPVFAAKYRRAVETARDETSSTDGVVTLNLSHLDNRSAQFAVPVVVPPASATLFLGVPAEGGTDRKRQLVLAFDHLVLNGDEAAAFLDTLTTVVERSDHQPSAATSLAVPAPRPATDVLDQIVAIAQQVLGQPVDPARPLGQQGLTSAGATLLAVKLNETFQASLPTTAVWHHPTCRQLAVALASAGTAEAPAPSPPTRPRGSEPIAVIGVAGRFARSPDLETFWELLCAGKDAFDSVPAERLPGFDPTGLPLDTPVSVRAALLDRVDEFDAGFFGMSARLARSIDPQQRLLLELSWHAWENAAVDPDSLAGTRTAVFVGQGGSDYRELAVRAGIADAYSGPGTLSSYLASRLSQFYDLAGPSMTVDTACSSALSAVSLAVDTLRAGSCDLAMAGSVNLICNGFNATAYYRAGMLSPTGRGTAFDDSCDGYVRGEGGGVLVLKRLADAQRDGDPIAGVIRGTAVNHGGRAASQTAPNPAAQTRLLRIALDNAGLGPAELGYLEAHGTATPLGDPLEMEALRAAMDSTAEHAGPGGRLWVGSAKATIGHLEGAAGIAGLIKALMVVERGKIPAMPGFTKLNQRIDLSSAPISVTDQPQEWPDREAPRRAGVSSFGLGGANAHVIVEQAPPAAHPLGPAPVTVAGQCLLPLSAASPDALRDLAARLAGFLEDRPGTRIDAVAATLQFGRQHMASRRLVVAEDIPSAVRALREFAIGDSEAAPMLSDVLPSADLSELAGWSDGAAIDWRQLWKGMPPPARIALVPYPFRRRQYWLPSPAPAADALIGSRPDVLEEQDVQN